MMNKLKLKKFITTLSSILIISLLMSCGTPYKDSQILCDYKDYNCLYWTSDTYIEYKYSDYIVDDISNGAYKKGSPSLADYRTGTGLLDYDIPRYVEDRMNYSIKQEMIKKYELQIDDFCAIIRDDVFTQKNSMIHFYDKNKKEDILLSSVPATNVSYDDETPTIAFDIPSNEAEDISAKESVDGRKINLSDVLASNMTPEGYMKVILAQGKEKKKFLMGEEIPKDVMEATTKAKEEQVKAGAIVEETDNETSINNESTVE